MRNVFNKTFCNKEDVVEISTIQALLSLSPVCNVHVCTYAYKYTHAEIPLQKIILFCCGFVQFVCK